MFRVLVFPGGTEIGLEIQRSLYQCKEVELYSVSSNTSNHAAYIFARHFVIPAVNEENWLEELNQIIAKNQIDYIFPAHDDVIVALAKNQARIQAKIISSPLETCLITRSKSKTYQNFCGILPIPRLYESIDQINTYPVFVKPDQGQGAQDTHLVSTEDQLISLLNGTNRYIVTEFLSGEEYTIDCFSDREQGLLFCSGRRRNRTRNGISMSSCTVEIPLFREYAIAISNQLALHGAWFFQLKQDNFGQYKLLEIAPRIAGTMALNRVQGINFPLLSIYEEARIPLTILTNKLTVEIDRALVNRYKHSLSYEKAYVDLDDTLIFKGKVNLDLIRFIYQCINKNISVVLITKHRHDVYQTLKKHRLSELFDEIIHLDKSKNKSDYICDEPSILIDDSFSERKAVSHRVGIPTFDCSMIEMLLDERV